VGVHDRKLDLYPKAKLLHLVAGSMRGNVAISQFAGFPLTTPRPASGTATHTTSCPQCGSRLTYKIWSQQLTQRARLAWIALAVLGPAAFGLAIAASSSGSLPTALGVLVFFGAPAATIGGFVQWWKEDGVRLQAPPPPSGPAAIVEMLNTGRHAIGFPTTSTRTYTKRPPRRRPPPGTHPGTRL
jgi:hypothetical protein